MKIFKTNKITILRIISIGALMPATISFILWRVGSLDIKTMAIINWIAFLAEFTVFLFVMKIKNPIITSHSNVVIQKGSYDEKTVKAETNIFLIFWYRLIYIEIVYFELVYR
jgi:hypothetical protein